MVKTNRIAAALFASVSLAAAVQAQQPTGTTTRAAEDAAATTPPEDVIVVTGTRRTDRTLADSPVPVDVIGGTQLQQTGLTETNKILNQLVPSFNFPQPSIADGTDVVRPATLRGLSPDQTLVLVNGKRRHVSALLNINGTIGRGAAAVDLNLIPTLAIERIEVLRDGASSQYGSDAIAGVINIQLRRADSGGRAVASFGKYVTTLSGVPELVGLQTANGQPVLSAADNRVFAGNYDGERKARDGDMYTYATNFGLPIAEGGFLNLTAEYRERGFTNRAGYDPRPNYNRPTAAFDSRELGFDRLSFRFGDAKTEDYNFFLNSAVPVGDWELYLFGSGGRRDGLSAANFRNQSAAANRDFSTLTPATTPTAANFVALTPDGFLPFIQTELGDYAATGGIRGEVAGWKADLSLGYGHNSFDYRVENTLNTSLGPNGPRAFDAGGVRFGQWLVNADVSREYDVGFAGNLSVAAGGEYRRENYKIRPGAVSSYALGPLFRASVASTAAGCATQGGVFTAATGICAFPGRAAAAGAQGFPGIPASAATDASRHSFAGYVELDAEVFDGFTATAAGRYEHFSDFGDTLNGKLALRYELTEWAALRGSVSNGFRAPSLHQQFFTTTSTNFVAGVPVDISTVAVSSPIARALGAQDLDPEKSLNLSGGVTMNPFRGFNFTFDYYHIKIDDRIVLTENLGAAGSGTAAVNAAVRSVLDANGFQSVGAARFFINGLDTTTNGFDAVATYRFGSGDAAFGNWSLTAAYNHNNNKIDKRLNALGPLAQIPNLILFGRLEGLRFTDGQPKDKLVLTAEANKGPFGVTARTTRYGSALSPEATAPLSNPLSLTDLGPDDQKLSAKWITDLEVRANIMKTLQVAVGANNLFDVYPDVRPVGARAAGVGGQYPVNYYYIPYSGFSPFGFNGRFLYGRVSLDF